MNPQQAGTMLHPAAEPRNATSTMPDLAAGHRGLLRSLASDTALGPSTTWVPPSGRLAYILTNNHPLTSIPLAALNCGSTKSGQDQRRRRHAERQLHPQRRRQRLRFLRRHHH